jgi:hypothetical protein
MVEPPALMHATQMARPFHTPGRIREEKYDGWRMLAVKEGVVRLISRMGVTIPRGLLIWSPRSQDFARSPSRLTVR